MFNLSVAGMMVGDQVRDLQTQLDQAKADITNLQSQVDTSKQHTEQYKNIADSIQQTINEQNKASTNFKETLEEKLAEAEQSKYPVTILMSSQSMDLSFYTGFKQCFYVHNLT